MNSIPDARLNFRSAINYDGTPAPPLVSVVLQDYQNRGVLFVATMDQEAWQLTLATSRIHVYSRTEKTTRCKGATSSDFLKVVSIFKNCNHDSLLINVRRLGKDGGTCHTKGQDGKTRPSCFFIQLI
ncbi:MAG: phosphoribosyl-AMP cyclohydrolase [Patescibacteria group bacterium]|mgnify:CR=1 FL=1